MDIHHLHRWDVTPQEAAAVQTDLASRISRHNCLHEVKIVAGADLGFSRDGSRAIAGVIAYSYPDLEEMERVFAIDDVRYPYIPGLLSFREGPVLEQAFAKLASDPDVIFFDGQGIAHPRRLGIASHMGLILDRPTIGCAKSRLCGTHAEPGPAVGDWEQLVDEKSGEAIGAVVRTRQRVKPIYVSIGHMVSFDRAREMVVACLDRTRIPKPTREADKYVRQLR